MIPARIRPCDRQTMLVAGFAACISVVSFLYFFHRGEVLLYGDAVAHINIARRVFDSRTPGLLQLGTVWLPLPHLLMIPFLFSDWMWRTGLGGSIPSMIAYVFGTVGIFRLVREVRSEDADHATAAGWAAATIYAANPNLIYLQSTAMTESLYLALFIWTLVYFVELIRNAPSSKSASVKCGVCILGACLTRYDGWFLAAAICGAAVIAFVKAGSGLLLKRDLRNLIILAAAGPIFWLIYNTAIYRNPLEFANGPYSAKAIEQRTSVSGASPHPGARNTGVAALYLLKSAELNMAGIRWLQRFWLILVIIGSLLCLVSSHRRLWPLLFLWAPLSFYAFSIAYGGVPLFVPEWWPFSYYNVRYGLEMLPAFAVFSVVAVHFIAKVIRHQKKQIAMVVIFFMFLAVSYGTIFRDPVCIREAFINSQTRIAVEEQLADYLFRLPQDSRVLMYLGDHVGALQQAGIPLRRVIHEGNHRVWRQPYDPDGLWERALATPEKYVDYVIAFEGDAVSIGVSKTKLKQLSVIDVAGQPRATVYGRQSPDI
jgi:hypothetical protein